MKYLLGAGQRATSDTIAHGAQSPQRDRVNISTQDKPHSLTCHYTQAAFQMFIAVVVSISDLV